MPEREYGSPYERVVLTSDGHPAKTKYDKLEYPQYIARSGFPWLAARKEEVVVLAFMALVFVYCASVYVGLYAASFPFRQALLSSWDLFVASMLALQVHSRMLPRPPSRKAIAAMPPAEQEEAERKRQRAQRAYSKRRNAALALCAGGALLRWYNGWGDLATLLKRVA